MSPSKRTIFLDTPFQGDLQTDFCWCPKRLRYLRFRYPQSFQNLGYPRKFTLKVILDTGRLVRKWLSEYSWICLLGDVSPMVPSCITIFHHHLEENFGWNFFQAPKSRKSKYCKRTFPMGFHVFCPKESREGLLRFFVSRCRILSSTSPMGGKHVKFSTSPSGKCSKWWALFHPILGVILILGKGAWHSSQTPKQCMYCTGMFDLWKLVRIDVCLAGN